MFVGPIVCPTPHPDTMTLLEHAQHCSDHIVEHYYLCMLALDAGEWATAHAHTCEMEDWVRELELGFMDPEIRQNLT